MTTSPGCVRDLPPFFGPGVLEFGLDSSGGLVKPAGKVITDNRQPVGTLVTDGIDK
jgi:hypothetical protein